MISSMLHGVLDYTVGLFLVVAPWFIRFENSGPAMIVPMALGCLTLIYSLFTNYELGRLKIISMRAHLVMDLLAAILLIASPWIFNFNDQIYLPHVVVGGVELLVVLLSDRVAFQSTTIEARNKASRPAHAQ